MTQRHGTQSQREPMFSQNTLNHRFNILAKPSSQYNNEEADLAKKADECVQYILFCCLSERKAVVRRVDLNKYVIKEHSRKYKEILKMVQVRLEEVFGIELVELDISDKAEKSGIRCMHVFDADLNRSSVTESSSEDMDPSFVEQFKYSMLMISLALIFMNENEMNGDLFWDSMKRLDINRDEKKHKYLGDVSKFFTVDLVKEGYLEHDLVRGMEPPTYKFKSGYRSKLEITKQSILEFVCNVYGGLDVCKPEEWSVQYSDAMKEYQDNDLHVTMEDDSNSTQVRSPETNQTQRSQKNQR